MFIVLLRFSDNKAQAGRFMDAHKQWLDRGFDEGVFLLSGSLESAGGGMIIANNTSFSALQERVNDDPFVAESVVTAEILAVAPSRAQQALHFLIRN